MFNYGLDQYVEVYLWQREREIRMLSEVNCARTENANGWGAYWAALERALVYVGRLFARLSHVPHGRAS